MSSIPTVSEAELRQAHRELNEPISFEAMTSSPALAICLRNLAEIRARQQERGARAPAAARAGLEQRPRPPRRDCKHAAANDRDD